MFLEILSQVEAFTVTDVTEKAEIKQTNQTPNKTQTDHRQIIFVLKGSKAELSSRTTSKKNTFSIKFPICLSQVITVTTQRRCT